MSMKKGMSRTARISIIMVIILLLVSGGVVGGILILGSKNADLPHVDVIKQLEKPLHVSVDNDWVLRFDKVEKAEGYQVAVGYKTGNSNYTWETETDLTLIDEGNSYKVDVSEYTQKLGDYSFQVRALHKTNAYNSDWSAEVEQTKEKRLSAPTNVWLNSTEMKYGWDPVNESEVKSYLLEFVDNNNKETKYYIEANSSIGTVYSFKEYLDKNPSITSFTVSVCASSQDSAGNCIAYVKDSDFVGEITYTKAELLPTLSDITIDFGEIKNDKLTVYYDSVDSLNISWSLLDADNSISQNYDNYIDYFMIYLDQQGYKISADKLSVDLVKAFNNETTGAKLLGEHTVRVEAVFKENVGAEPITKSFKYSVRKKFEMSNVTLEKYDLTLMVSWGSINNVNAQYELQFWGRNSESGDFGNLGENYSVKLVETVYSQELEGSLEDYKSIKVKVRAVPRTANGLYEESDWVESNILSVSTQLLPINNIRLDKSDQGVNISWSNNDSNPSNQYTRYKLEVYSATTSGSQIIVKNFAKDIYSDATNISITEELKKYSNIAAGSYVVKVSVVPRDNWINYYIASEATQSDIFEYKKQLASPSFITLSCEEPDSIDEYGTPKRTFIFKGVEGAQEYQIVIKASDGSFDKTLDVIEQPEDFSYIDVSDKLDYALRNIHAPNTYSVTIQAISNSDGLITNSGQIKESYTDKFVHKAVGGISVNTDAVNPNKITVSWNNSDSVSTMTNPYYTLVVIDKKNSGELGELYRKTYSPVYSDVSGTTSRVLDEDMFPGEYKITVVCPEIFGEYYARMVSTEYTFNYTILDTDVEGLEIKNELINQTGNDKKIRVSFAYPEAWIKSNQYSIQSFAIQIGEGAIHNMTLDTTKKIVYYDADFNTELPLYERKNTQIHIGGSVAIDGTITRQDYIKAYQTKTVDLVNAYEACTPTLQNSDDGATITITIPAEAVEYTSEIYYKVFFNGGDCLNADNLPGVIKSIANEMTLDLSSLKDSDGFMPKGDYEIKVQAVSIYGQESDWVELNYSQELTLANITGFVEGGNNAYLQWNQVPGGSGYSVIYSVEIFKDNESLGTDASLGLSLSYGTDSEGNDYVRLPTTQLFSDNGKGTYTFKITASANVTWIKSSTTDHVWVFESKLNAPSFEVKKDGKQVYVEIITSQFVKEYVVTVPGFEVGGADYQVTQTNTNTSTQKVYLDKLNAGGQFVISVVANPNSTKLAPSDASTQKFVNSVSPSAPDNVSVVQDGDNVKLSWDPKKWTIWSVSGESATGIEYDLALCIQVYKNNTLIADNIEIGNSGTFTLTADSEDTDIQNLMATLKENISECYVYFYTKPVEMSVVDSDGVKSTVVLTKGDNAAVNFTYKAKFDKPTFALSSSDNRLTVVNSLEFNVTKDSRALTIGIQIATKNSSDEYVNFATLGGQTVKGNKYVLSASAISGITSGTYYVRANATENAGFNSSDYTDYIEFTYAESLGTISGIQVSQEYKSSTVSGTGSATYKLFVTFNKVTNADSYIVSMWYNSAKYTDFVVDDTYSDNDKVRYVLDYSNSQYRALQDVWGEKPDDGLNLKFSITANPIEDNRAFWDSAETQYIYSVGGVAVPTGFGFSLSEDNKLTVSWQHGTNGTAYTTGEYELTYNFTLYYQSNDMTSANSITRDTTLLGNATQSVTIDLSDKNLDLSTTAYLFTFKINDIQVKNANDSSSAELVAQKSSEDTIEAQWVNTITNTIASASIAITYTYNESDGGTYTIGIRHKSGNNNVFGGQTYSLQINGENIFSNITAGTYTETTSVKFRENITANNESMIFWQLAKLSNAQESYDMGLNYSLTISNASVSGNSALIGYKGGTVTRTASLPILISMAPNVTIDLGNTTATWGAVTHATEYGFDIKDTSGNSVIGGEKTIRSQQTYNFSTLWADLDGGDYKIVVRVIADTSYIYVSTGAVSSTDVTKYVYMQDVESFKIDTASNGHGDFKTDITWYYNDQEGKSVDTSLFELTVTDAKGEVVDLGDDYKSMIHINFRDTPASRTQFVLTFVGRDLTQGGYPLVSNVVDGVNYTYDPTRNWLPGDYNISITVLSNDNSNIYLKPTTSELKQYQNKFGVAKVSGTAESLFTIAPDCYLNADGTVKAECKEALAEYEKKYGFNKKFLILTATGQLYNLGTHYKITVNEGNQTGYIINSSSDLSDILSTENSDIDKRLDISAGLNAGINTISIMPSVQDPTNTIPSYYAYIDENMPYYFSSTKASDIAKIQSALTTTFEEIVCYKRYETPSSDYSLNLGYNDTISGTNHNLSKVNVVFDSAKAHKNYLYSVKLYYADNYYNNGTEISEPILLGNDFTSLITDNINYGIQLYDSIKGYGPHKMWFEISVVGNKDLTDEQSQYYLESVVISTKNNAFINKTAVQEFSENEASQNSRTVSRVLEYTSENCEEDNDHKKNGCLRWNITENPYDMVIEYAVTLKDVDKKYAKTYKARITLTVNNGVREYALQQYKGDNISDTGPFFLENASDDGKSYLYFDMTEYFLNKDDIRAGVDDYLAGTYYYTISATALDKEGKEFEGTDVAIFSPVNTYPIDSDKKFEYKNVVYPFAPYDAVLKADGKLTWNYPEDGNKYSTGDITYKIRIDHLVTENGVSHWEEDVYKNLNTKEMSYEIADYLIAGGAETNRVYVCRVSPDTSLYLNSKYEQAEYNFPTNFTMPKLNLEWVNSSIKYSIVGLGGDAYQKMKTAVESSSEYKTWYELNVIRVDSSELENIAKENQNYDYIINNTEITTKAVIKFNGDPTKTDATEYLESLYYNIGDANDEYKFFNLYEEIDTRMKKDSSVKSEDWISNDKLLPGTYFVNMRFCTNMQYYDDSDNPLTHSIKQSWSVRSLDDVELDGEDLITKTAEEEVPTGEKTRNWANADKKSAVLKFQVKTIRVNGVSYLPEKITVIAKRVSQDEDSTTEEESSTDYRTETYCLPELAKLGSNDDYYTSGDITISRVNGIGNENYIEVKIDIHALFDTQDNAGPYELLWRIEEDENGAESYDYNNDSKGGYYVYNKYICHYIVFQTPILDYRMDIDIDDTDGSANYKLNWALTPNPNNYAVNVVDCNVNIFAFPEKDGTFVYDELYQATENKNFYLQDKFDNADFKEKLKTAGVNFVTNRSVKGCSYVYSVSDSNMALVPNTTYKFFIFLRTSKVSSGEFLKYYLNSETSAPVVYTYKKVSPSFAGVAVGAEEDKDGNPVYYVEGSDNKNEIFYTISAVQHNNDYNNAIELYVYDTQDEAAGTNANWTENQEINGNYLAHYIISTEDNAKTGNLRIVTVNTNGTLNYGKQVGSLEYKNSQSIFTLDGLTLADMLYNENQGIDRTTTAITYYCKIKSWINNYEVNKNVYESDGETLTVQTSKTQIYSADWIRETLGITDEETVNAYLAAFDKKGISTINRDILDINALNPSIYFRLQHRVEFQKPMISKIEIFDGENSGDVSGSCVGVYDSNDDGTVVVTDGYITANNQGEYIYRIWLNNVYNTDPAYRADKNIVIAVQALKYDGFGKLSDSTDSTSSTYRVTYVQDSETSTWLAYVDISAKIDENVTGEGIFSWINRQLPNTLVFSALAVQKTETNNTQNADDSATQTIEGSNVGGANSENEFYLTGTTVINLQGDRLSATDNPYTIARIFEKSEVSAGATITVKKQYATPVLHLLYGNQKSGINLLDEYNVWKKSIDGTEIVTNVLNEDGNSYDGMALDPYLNMDVSGYDAEYELLNLKNNTTTQYKVTLTYITNPEIQATKTKDYWFNTTDILGALSNASSVANLYDKIYNLINEDLPADKYHGGKVQITVSIVTASEPAEAGYWVGSDASDSELMFYARMEQVSVKELDPEDAQYTMPDGNDTEYHIATYYAKKELTYLYYQSYIPVVYNSINKSGVTYRVILTNIDNDGENDGLVYNFDTLGARLGEQINPAEWIGSATAGEENIGNLANLLGVDLNDLESGDARNQWAREKVWTINILAYSDVVAPKTVVTNGENTEFITRGLDSEVRTYQPQLKIVNDIDGINTKITTIDNEEVIDITDDNLSTDDLKKYIAYTPTDEITNLLGVNFDEKDEIEDQYPNATDGDIGNRKVINPKFKLYYQTLDADGNVISEQVKNGKEKEDWASFTIEEKNIKEGVHHPYILKLIFDYYFKDCLRPGGLYVIKDLSFFEFNVPQNVLPLAESKTTDITFEYYTQINPDDILIKAVQDGTSIKFTGTVKNELITSVAVRLKQTTIENSTDTESLIKIYDNSECEVLDDGSWTFTDSVEFNVNKADCFSDTSFDEYQADLLTTRGYVSREFAGYIQAGINKFRFYPILLEPDYYRPTGYYKEANDVNFIVPESLCPSVSLSGDTSEVGGGRVRRSYNQQVTCPTTVTTGRVTISDCGTCRGSGTVTKKITCTSCGGSGKIFTGFGPHSYAGTIFTCRLCKRDLTHLLETACPGNPQYETCSACSGNGYKYKSVACSACSGKGTITTSTTITETCPTCEGKGYYYKKAYYYYYYAYYQYITKVTPTFKNYGGATAIGEVEYGWKSNHSGSCTNTIFTKTANSTDIDELIKGISTTGANYAKFTVMINCKEYFEDVFENPTYTATRTFDVSSAHYEAH